MTDAIGASLLRAVLADVRAGGGAIEEAHGQALAALGPGDLQLVQAASELVERRAVKRFQAKPSGRVFFRVESLNRYHHQQQQPHSEWGYDAVLSSQAPPTSAAVSSGYYDCVEHFCSCSGFVSVAMRDPRAMCKHMVALLLADATGTCVELEIPDADFATMFGHVGITH